MAEAESQAGVDEIELPHPNHRFLFSLIVEGPCNQISKEALILTDHRLPTKEKSSAMESRPCIREARLVKGEGYTDACPLVERDRNDKESPD